MKKSMAILSGLLLLVSVAGCADLGFGVDVDSSGVSPYWYGNGYMGDTYWNTPVWNYGPIYNPIPPRPPLVGNGPGSVISPPVSKPVPVRPAQKPRPPQVNLGPNGIGWNPGPTIPTTVNGIQRPGNGGLPNPTTVPSGRPIRR